MNLFAWEGIMSIVRANAMVLGMAVLIGCLLKLVRLRSPTVHRFAWSVVLLQGLILVPVTVSIPWFAPEPPVAELVVRSSDSMNGDLLAFLPEPVSTTRENDAFTRQTQSVESISRARWLPIPMFIGAVWLGGMAFFVLRDLVRYRALLRSLASATAAPPPHQQEWQSLCRRHRISPTNPLLYHSSLGPMICRRRSGYAVVVPVEFWKQLTQSERTAILSHELAHLRRGDLWKNLLARLIALPNWFNPVIWMALRRFEEAAEWACDDFFAKKSPQHVPTYARALLRLVESDRFAVGLSAASGAPLGQRIRRLLSPSEGDATWKQGLVLTIAFVTALSAAVQLDLVARPAAAQESEHHQDTLHLRNRLSEFAAKIQSEGNRSVERFKAALQTEVGQVVAQDEIGWIEETLRNRAKDNAIPQYLEKYFSAAGEIRDPDFAKRLVSNTIQYNTDIEEVRQALRNLAAKVSDQSEDNRLLKRFLEHDASASILYFRELRKVLRPDADAVAERLGEVLVRIGKEYQVRAGSREEVERVAQGFDRAQRAYSAIRGDLAEFAKEFASTGELTQRLQQAMQGKTLAAMAALRIGENVDEPLTQQIDNFFEELEWMAIDKADGLAVRAEAKAEVQEHLQEVHRIEQATQKLKSAVHDFAKQVSTKDALHARLREFMQSDLGVVRLASDYELMTSSVEDAVEAFVAEGIQTKADGSVALRPEIAAEFVEQARDIMREYRTLLRKTKPIHRFADKVSDRLTAQALQSVAGKLVIANAIRKEFAGTQFEGFEAWINQRFENTDTGYRLLADSEAMLQEFLERVDEVQAELDDADF